MTRWSTLPFQTTNQSTDLARDVAKMKLDWWTPFSPLFGSLLLFTLAVSPDFVYILAIWLAWCRLHSCVADVTFAHGLEDIHQTRSQSERLPHLVSRSWFKHGHEIPTAVIADFQGHCDGNAVTMLSPMSCEDSHNEELSPTCHARFHRICQP